MENTIIDVQKQHARKQAKQWRTHLHEKHHKTAANKLAEMAAIIIDAFPVSIIAGFYPIYTEINISPLLKELALMGCRLCLPVTPSAPQNMIFRAYTPEQHLESGPFNTQHPPVTAKECVPELILMPLLAFDSNCNRLGYGSGYYDRTINALFNSGQTVKLIGVAYSGQEVDKVPISSTDQAMDGVLTPAGLYVR